MYFLDIYNFPGVQYLNLMMRHSIHDRGQLSVYVRLTGGFVPSTYGPSADGNPFAHLFNEPAAGEG